VAVAQQHLRARSRRHDRTVAAVVRDRDEPAHRGMARQRVRDLLELAARRARRDDERDHDVARRLADHDVAQLAGALLLVVRNELRALGRAAHPGRELVDDRRDDLAPERVDHEVRARCIRAEDHVRAREPRDVLALVAVAEQRRRRPHVPDGDPHLAEGRHDPRALALELRRIRQVLPHAAAAPPERRALRLDARLARPPDPPHDPPPRLGPVRTGVVDRDLGALAGQEIGDVHAHAGGEPYAEAALVELGCGHVAALRLHAATLARSAKVRAWVSS
jgi:hypothetical protein